MPHFHGEKRSRFEKTPPEWLPIGGQLNILANGWAARDDILTFVGEGAGQGSPACFVPNISEMEVDVTLAFMEGAKAEFIPDLTVRDNQFDYPVCMGAVLHESMHAKHSKWDLAECAKKVAGKDKDPFAHALITDFEETRIEARGIRKFPENTAFLRACALKLVIGDIKEDENFADKGHQSMSKLMLLTMARVDAGVLKEDDVKIIADAAEKLYGEPLVKKLRAVWLKAQAHSVDDEWEPLHALALEWIKLLEDAGHEPRKESEVPQWVKDLLKSMVKMPGSPGDGESGEGEGEGDPASAEGKGGIVIEILVEMAEAAEIAAGNDATDQAIQEQSAGLAREHQAAVKEKNEMEAQAADVFGRGTGPGPSKSNSKLIEVREPTGPERAAAVALAKDLERARYRDRLVQEKNAAAPPGKLRMRSAMAAAAETSRGGMSTQEPWKTKRRHHVEDPNLKVGVLVDISGSMKRAMQPMAATAWVLSEAVKRVQGQAGMVYFGNDVFPTLAPGQHLDKVHVYSAADGTERFNKAFTALNGQMDLLGSSGARLLVVVSDLWHSGNEIEAEEKWFNRCRQAGVAVIVVAPGRDVMQNIQDVLGKNGTCVQLDLTDTAATARLIGAAAVKELQAASR